MPRILNAIIQPPLIWGSLFSTHVILTSGACWGGSEQRLLTPDPADPLNPADPADPLNPRMSSKSPRQVYLDPSGLNSLSSDMLTFTKITENKDSGLTFSRVFVDIFLPDMRFSRGFINIWPLEFLRVPLGSLWEHFSDILVSIGDPLGVHWGIFRVPLDPFAYPLDPFGVTVAVLGPPWVLFWMTFASF